MPTATREKKKSLQLRKICNHDGTLQKDVRAHVLWEITRIMADRGFDFNESGKYGEIMLEILDFMEKSYHGASGGSLSESQQELVDEAQALMDQLKIMPKQIATVIALDGNMVGVRGEDGASVMLPTQTLKMTEEIKVGDVVTLVKIPMTTDMVVGSASYIPQTGEQANFNSMVGDDRVEVEMRGEKMVMVATPELIEQIKTDQVQHGDDITVNSRQMVAYQGITDQREKSKIRYRNIDNRPMPDVRVQRDLGAPPPFISELLNHIEVEMTDPGIRRKYRQPRCSMRLLEGVSGSGKTFAIDAFLCELNLMIAKIIGCKPDELPNRVLRLRSAKILSQWLGESDKNLDRYFDEVDAMADETFEHDGKTYTLPVIALGEEIDALARQRGGDQGSGGVYDRVMTTALQRLDTTHQTVRDRLVIYIFSTNVPHLVDPAFLRRAGGKIDHFGRLNREQFSAVLGKHLDGLPLSGEKTAMTGALCKWAYSEEKDARAVTVKMQSGQELRYRRDLLTCGLVARAVSAAAAQSCEDEYGNRGESVSVDCLIHHFDDQVYGTVKQLHVSNVREYMELPDAARVETVKRLYRQGNGENNGV